MKKRLLSIVLAASVLLATSISTFVVIGANNQPKVKNVIMMIPDGMSIGATTLSKYSIDQTGAKNLEMDKYFTGLVKTRWTNGPITDSAPAGTAYSTGYKSISGALGVDENKIPKATLLEVAQIQGKATGLIATSEFMHATPAAYSSHEAARSNYANIAEQMLNQKIDVLLGTGSSKVPTATLDIPTLAQAEGYTLLNNKAELQATTATKLWGDFVATVGGKNNMSYDKDRNDATEPSLEDMTKKAIEVLSKNNNGFFLMVEGSKIDWAAHAHDTVGIVTDTLAFDNAFKAAVDFAKADGNTVVISVTDHGNSGITIGSYTSAKYDSDPYSLLTPISTATKTAEGALTLLDATKSDESKKAVLRAYGIAKDSYAATDFASLSSSLIASATNTAIAAFMADPKTDTLVDIMNKMCVIGYTTSGHTGEDVPMYVYAPDSYTLPQGVIQNTDVAKFIASCMDANLDNASNELFVDVTNKGTIDATTKEFTFNTTNGKSVKIKANQSVATIDGVTVDLNGQVAVYTNSKFYVPKALSDMVDTTLNLVGRYSTGVNNAAGGVTEIVKYNSDNNKFYVVNGNSKKLDIVSIDSVNSSSLTNLSSEKSIDIAALIKAVDTTFTYGDLTSVDVNTDADIIAVAVQEQAHDRNGKIALLDYNGNLLKLVDCGIQPDMITFTADKKYILTANEGEPRMGYADGTVDPMGSVTIVDIKNGVSNASAATVDFTSFDSQRDSLIANNVILKKNTMPSVDLEPEFIAVSDDSKTAYVSLQEANAIATLDIENKCFTKINGLGFKDHAKAGNEIDIYRDGKISIKSEPNFRGMYNPDGITTFTQNGKTYLLTANEGDSRDWNGYLNEKDIQLASTGRDGGTKAITVTAFNTSDYDGNFETDKTYLFGARSFAIWDTQTMTLVYDSGANLEKITASRLPQYFNWSNDDTVFEKRSAKKGPEPEDIRIGTVDGKPYAFVGLERIGGNVIFDISDVMSPKYVSYTNTRDFSSAIAGDVSPEGQCFIPASKSPIGVPMLLVANEVSGTVSVYAMQNTTLAQTTTTPSFRIAEVNKSQAKYDLNKVEYVLYGKTINGQYTISTELAISSNLELISAEKLDSNILTLTNKVVDGKLNILTTYATPTSSTDEIPLLKLSFNIASSAIYGEAMTVTINKAQTSTTSQTSTGIIKNPTATTIFTQYSKYDLVRDNICDTKDLAVVLSYYQARNTDADWLTKSIADVNGDNKVDIQDIMDFIKNINW